MECGADTGSFVTAACKHPSAGLKFGHDVVRMADSKEILAIKTGNETAEKEAKQVVRILKKEWPLKISICSRETLDMRRAEKDEVSKLPIPQDLKKISVFLTDELKILDLTLPDSEVYICGLFVSSKLD